MKPPVHVFVGATFLSLHGETEYPVSIITPTGHNAALTFLFIYCTLPIHRAPVQQNSKKIKEIVLNL